MSRLFNMEDIKFFYEDDAVEGIHISYGGNRVRHIYQNKQTPWFDMSFLKERDGESKYE